MVALKRALSMAGVLRATVYHDQNEDGVFDCDELGIAGIGMDIVECNAQGAIHAEYSTDSNGLMEVEYDLSFETARWQMFLPNAYEVTHVTNSLSEDVAFVVNPVSDLGFAYVESGDCNIAGDGLVYELNIGLKLKSAPTVDKCDFGLLGVGDHASSDTSRSKKESKSKRGKGSSSKSKKSSKDSKSNQSTQRSRRRIMRE